MRHTGAPPAPAQAPPPAQEPDAAPYYLDDDEDLLVPEQQGQGAPAPWDEPTAAQRPPRHWHETTAQVDNPTIEEPETNTDMMDLAPADTDMMEIASADIETLDPGPYQLSEAKTAPPEVRPPEAQEPERRRSPFGADLHQATSMNTGQTFQPELQTRIVQNPLADPELAMEQISERFAAPEATAEMGKLLVFFSCHGGSGSSMLAVNMAAVAADTGRQTCVVDLDLQLGDVLTMLDLESTCPMSKIASDMENFDWQMLSPLLARHASGLCAMSQVGHIEELSELDPGRVPTFLRYLQQHFNFVVVDGLRDFNDHALAAMDVADRIVLVLTQDVAAIRGARMRLDLLQRLGYAPDRFYALLNRYDPKNKLTLEHVGEALGIPVAITVPNDFRLVHESITQGQTLYQLNPQAKISRALDTAARAALDLPEPELRKGFFGRLFGKKKKKKEKKEKKEA